MAIAVFFLSVSYLAEAADYTSSQTGNWNDAATWGGGGTPGAGDTATVVDSHTVTLTQAEQCEHLMVNAGGIVNTVTFSLTVDDAAYFDAWFDGGTANQNFGALIVNATGVFNATSATTTISGNFDNDGTFTHNDGTVFISGSGIKNLYGSFTGSNAFYNLGGNNGHLVRANNNVDILHDLSGNIYFQLYVNNVVVTLGNDTYASQITSAGFDGNSGYTNQTVQGANQLYPAEFKSSLNYLRFFGVPGEANYMSSDAHAKWVDVQKAVTTPGSSKTITLDGDCEFDAFTVSSGDTLDLNGHKASINGTFTTTGTLTTGTTSEIELLSNGAWTMNQNASLKALNVNGTFDINAGITLTFTDIEGFGASAGTLNTTGTFSNLAYITGSGWQIDPDLLTNYWFWYTNFTHGNNIGATKTIVALGEGYNLTGSWDFLAPALTSHIISEGYIQDKATNASLWFNFTATDMTFLHSMNFTIYRLYNSSMMLSREIDLTSLEVAEYLWNQSKNISSWQPGTYNITFIAKDCHNPPTSKAGKQRIDDMVVVVDGEVIGKKGIKKVKDKPAEKIDFNTITGETISSIYSLLFVDEKNVKHTVVWDAEKGNFKLTHYVKTSLTTYQPPTGGPAPKVIGVKVKLTAQTIEYLPLSPYYGHFIINGAYFYDAQDFRDEGGSLFIEQKTRTKTSESYTLIFINPLWKKNEWVLIDPLSGSINEGSLGPLNFTITAAPTLVAPTPNGTIITTFSPTLTVYVEGFSGTATVTFYNYADNTSIGTQSGIANDSDVSITWGALDANTEYSWYAVLTVDAFDSNSTFWTFTTPKTVSPQELSHEDTPPTYLLPLIVFFISCMLFFAIVQTFQMKKTHNQR